MEDQVQVQVQVQARFVMSVLSKYEVATLVPDFWMMCCSTASLHNLFIAAQKSNSTCAKAPLVTESCTKGPPESCMLIAS